MVVFFNKILSFADRLVVSYPASSRLSYFWNFGSILGMVLAIQIMSGIFLVFFYVPSILEGFSSVDFISREVFIGYLIRVIHLNGSSVFFLFLFLHLGRGLFLKRFLLHNTWMSGVTIIILVIATAFLGYVLPWGQMSFWGGTVITNLISVIPIFGTSIVLWLWGGFNVGMPTLSFFFTIHYLLPFVVSVVVFLHLLFLHETGRSNSLRINDRIYIVSFNPYFSRKDALNLTFLSTLYLLCFFRPWTLGDPENWIPSNPLSRPIHIQPEWYFLFAYAILRCIPNKLGGVIALVIRVALFYLLPLIVNNIRRTIRIFYLANLSLFVVRFLLLTWLGSCPVEEPYIFIRQIFSLVYFASLFGIAFL